MLEWVGLIIKSFFLVPLMAIAALFNGALCFIGVDLACQELDYNLDLLLSSAIIAGATIAALFVVAPTVWLLVTNPDVAIERIKKVILFIPNKIVALFAWLHYFFVPHPAEAMIKEATRQGEPQPIDTSQFAEKMKRKMSLDPDDAPAGFKSENQTKKAEKLAARIEAERKLMEAVREREQALRNAKRGKRTQ